MSRGDLTGEFTMISGQRCLVRGRVTSDAELLEVTPAGSHSIVARDPELSNIFMRAFILRRRELVNAQAGDVILLGSRYSANTLRLREFLTRNQHPYQYLDLDKDQAAQLVWIGSMCAPMRFRC